MQEETIQQGCFVGRALCEIFIFRLLLHVDDDNRSRFLVDPDYPTTIDLDFCLIRLKRWRRRLSIHSRGQETVGPREVNKTGRVFYPERSVVTVLNWSGYVWTTNHVDNGCVVEWKGHSGFMSSESFTSLPPFRFEDKAWPKNSTFSPNYFGRSAAAGCTSDDRVLHCIDLEVSHLA